MADVVLRARNNAEISVMILRKLVVARTEGSYGVVSIAKSIAALREFASFSKARHAVERLHAHSLPLLAGPILFVE
jgi:hypothetical protein